MGAAEYTIYGSTDLERLHSTGIWVDYSSSLRTLRLLLGEDGSLGKPVDLATRIARDKAKWVRLNVLASKPNQVTYTPCKAIHGIQACISY